MGRGLAHVKNRLALQMMRPDLVRDHDQPPSRAASLSSQHGRGPTASSGSCPLPAPPPAAPALRARPWGRSTGRSRTDLSDAADAIVDCVGILSLSLSS